MPEATTNYGNQQDDDDADFARKKQRKIPKWWCNTYNDVQLDELPYMGMGGRSKRGNTFDMVNYALMANCQ